MNWTDKDEADFQKSVKLREQFKTEIGIRSTCKSLRDLADRLEAGERVPYNVTTEFLTHKLMDVYQPIPYAKQITITIPFAEER